MTNFHDKLYHSNSDLEGDPNKPQEGSRKTSFAFVSDYVEIVVRSELSPPRLLGANFLSEHIPSQFAFSILCNVCGLFFFFFLVFTLRFLKKLQNLVYSGVEIACCVALCTVDAILCLTFAQHVLPTHLVTKQLLSTLDLASFMVSLLHLRLTLNTHCSGLRPTFEVQLSSLPVS